MLSKAIQSFVALMKHLFVVFLLATVTGCAVNPDADRELREQRRRTDSARSAAEEAVKPLAPDSGQYDMPRAPVSPGGSDMPVVDPTDTASVIPL